MDFQINVAISKVDAEQGLVFGWGFIATEDGKPYVDLQREFIPESTIVKVSSDFARGARVAKEMHEGPPAGTVEFIWPMTADIAKALGVETSRTGMLVGMRPAPTMLAKFKSGEYTGFSIGGRGTRREVEIP